MNFKQALIAINIFKPFCCTGTYGTSLAVNPLSMLKMQYYAFHQFARMQICRDAVACHATLSRILEKRSLICKGFRHFLPS